MKVRTMVGRYRMLFGGKSKWVTGVALVVFCCLGYLTLNVANLLGVVAPLPLGNWMTVLSFALLVVILAATLNKRADKARGR